MTLDPIREVLELGSEKERPLLWALWKSISSAISPPSSTAPKEKMGPVKATEKGETIYLEFSASTTILLGVRVTEAGKTQRRENPANMNMISLFIFQ